jgi:hypothetical protein
VVVKLDLYEGMIHNFGDRTPDPPASVLAPGEGSDESGAAEDE